MAAWIGRGLAALAGAMLASCSVTVSDLSELREDIEACPPGGDPQTLRDLSLHLEAMGIHASNLFEATVINQSSGVLASRVIYDPLVEGTIQIDVPNAVPRGDHFLDFYADLDNNRVYSAQPDDHTWRRPICADGSLFFVHRAEFEDLDNGRPIGGAFTLTLNNVPQSARDGSVEVRVIADFDAGESQTVGVYRRTNFVENRRVPLPDRIEGLVIPDILDGGTSHRIIYFFDVDRDGEAGEGDLICETTAVAAPSGITLDLDVSIEVSAGRCALTSLPAL